MNKEYLYLKYLGGEWKALKGRLLTNFVSVKIEKGESLLFK